MGWRFVEKPPVPVLRHCKAQTIVVPVARAHPCVERWHDFKRAKNRKSGWKDFNKKPEFHFRGINLSSYLEFCDWIALCRFYEFIDTNRMLETDSSHSYDTHYSRVLRLLRIAEDHGIPIEKNMAIQTRDSGEHRSNVTVVLEWRILCSQEWLDRYFAPRGFLPDTKTVEVNPRRFKLGWCFGPIRGSGRLRGIHAHRNKILQTT